VGDFVQHLESRLVDAERGSELTHLAFGPGRWVAFHERHHDCELNGALSSMRVGDDERHVLERDGLEGVGGEVLSVDARDPFNQGALGLREAIVGERDVTECSQHGVELGVREDLEVHAGA
jgi:hypothetical protein